MVAPLNLTNKRFGRLIAIEGGFRKGTKPAWRCRCDCGGERIVAVHRLQAGTCRSCGCLMDEQRQAAGLGKTHGYCEHSLFAIWRGMIRRCHEQKSKDFKSYGTRGIRVCDRWRDSFEAFCLDMGKRPTPKHSIDRIDNDGNYEPSNCRWATHKEQMNNTRRTKKRRQSR